MATALVPVDMIEQELTCSICLSLLREPKDLDCSHTFCLDCLKQYVKKEPTIECPECRHITIVPQKGLTKLKTNLRSKNMVENLIKSTGVSNKNRTEVPMCPSHMGERQHFFCVTCSVSVCHNCLVLKHPKPQHEIREWKEDMEEREGQRQKKNQELDDVEAKLKSAKDKAEQEVESHIQHVTTEMKTWEKEMNQDIETMYQKCINFHQEKRTELHRSITSGMSKLSIQQDHTLSDDITILHLEPKQMNSSSFGKLVTSGCKRSIVSANQTQVGSANKELKLTLHTEFRAEMFANRVAANQSNLIAVADDDCRVRIYDKCNNKYKNQRHFRLDYNAHSVAVSSKGKFFVPDGDEMKIFSSAGIYESSWPKSVNAHRIAITPDDMVVIGHTSGHVIPVHQCDGELIRTHQVECRTMIDIASNGKHIAFTTESTICVIDFVTGHTLWKRSDYFQRGICYEQKSNTLLVSRGNRDKCEIVQQCSTTGRLISNLASGLYLPTGMTVTRDNKLVVANCQTVVIYNID